MKIFSGAKNKQIDRSTAKGLTSINLLVTPGLGTMMAGKFLVGAVQLAFASAGFILIMKWFYSLFRSVVAGSAWGAAWEWQVGACLFGIGWLGSLWSSVNLMREASERSLATPPKLDGSPD